MLTGAILLSTTVDSYFSMAVQGTYQYYFYVICTALFLKRQITNFARNESSITVSCFFFADFEYVEVERIMYGGIMSETIASITFL